MIHIFEKADITWTFVIILSRGVDEENSFLQQNVEKKNVSDFFRTKLKESLQLSIYYK